MATSLDRFERLFTSASRRKTPSVPLDPDLRAPHKPVDLVEPLFPSPSFIRPRSNRMTAREEVLVSSAQQASRRAQSLPSPSVPRYTSSSQMSMPYRQQASYSLHHSFHCQGQSPLGHRPSSPGTLQLRSSHPSRSTSMVNRRTEVMEFGLQSFEFPPVPPRHNGENSPLSMSSSIYSSTHLPGDSSPRSGSPPNSPRSSSTGSRLRTCASSVDLDASLQVQRNDFRLKPPSRPSYRPLPQPNDRSICRPPTPGPSPDLPPTVSANPCFVLDLASASNDDFTSVRPSSLHSSASSILVEPPVTEFLNLSDDDIAETRPGTPGTLATCPDTPLTPPATISTASPASSRTTSVLTIPPPHSTLHPAAAVAAFEATRIAGKYNFDLVYVLNLWPGERPPKRSDGSKRKDGSAQGMTGRILAAYGLSDIGSPFQISAAVHAKILNAEGWIEYRSQTERPDDFACGYARAFYTGKYSPSGAKEPSPKFQALESCPRELVDRGILFAAYRKPGKHGQDIGCSPSELVDLYQSVETLVEMLIDMHVAQGLDQPASRALQLELTGPMPVQRPNNFV